MWVISMILLINIFYIVYLDIKNHKLEEKIKEMEIKENGRK